MLTTKFDKEEEEEVNSEERGAWTSELRIVHTMTVVVPVKLYGVMQLLADDEDIDDNEFSIITWIDQEKSDGDRIVLKKEFYIPKQTVTTVKIDYGPDEKNGDVVIHRHPNGCNFFSNVDAEHINQNYTVSLLFTKVGGFIKGIYNLSLNEDVKIQVPVTIEIDYGVKIPDKKNIEVERKTSYFSSSSPSSIPSKKIYYDADEYYKRNNLFSDVVEENKLETNEEDTEGFDMGPFKRNVPQFESGIWGKHEVLRSLKEGD
jgi:hypothetical protein